MLKVAREASCRIFTGKNGVKTGILAHPAGVSTLGAVFALGGQDGKHSGETYITLKSKVFEAISSPQSCYRYGISTHVAVEKENCAVLFQFLQESSARALAIFEKLFDGRTPSNISVGLARYDLGRQGLLGVATPATLLESLAYAASFDEPRAKTKVFPRVPERVAFNVDLLKRLSASCILIGSPDQQEALQKFSESLPKSVIAARPSRTHFAPGLIARERPKMGIVGGKVVKRPSNVDFAMAWEAGNVAAEDFFAFKVMEKVFGGGSAFSSDGLGVGTVSSLLSKHVLYRLPSCEDIRASFCPYRTNGLFTVTVNVPGDEMKRAGRMVKNAIDRLPEIDDGVLSAAKEQAILSHLKDLDSGKNRMLEFGNDLLCYGEGKSVAGVVSALRGVTKDQLCAAFKKTFASNPTVAVIGNGKPESVLEAWSKPGA